MINSFQTNCVFTPLCKIISSLNSNSCVMETFSSSAATFNNLSKIFLQAWIAALPLRSAPLLAAVADVFATRVVFVVSILILSCETENVFATAILFSHLHLVPFQQLQYLTPMLPSV